MSKKKKLCMKKFYLREEQLSWNSQQGPNKVVNLFIYSPSLARSKHTSQCNELLGDIWVAAEHFPLLGKGTMPLHLCVFFRPGRLLRTSEDILPNMFQKKRQLEGWGFFRKWKHMKYSMVLKALFDSEKRNYSVNRESCWCLVWEGVHVLQGSLCPD